MSWRIIHKKEFRDQYKLHTIIFPNSGVKFKVFWKYSSDGGAGENIIILAINPIEKRLFLRFRTKE